MLAGLLLGCGPKEEEPTRRGGVEGQVMDAVRASIEEAVTANPAGPASAGQPPAGEAPAVTAPAPPMSETALLSEPASAPGTETTTAPSPFAPQGGVEAAGTPSPFSPANGGGTPATPSPFTASADSSAATPAPIELGGGSAGFEGSLTAEAASDVVSTTLDDSDTSGGAGPGYSLEVQPPSLPEWGYEGEKGPAAWAGLAPVCVPCGEGQQQSPIDLGGAGGADLSNPVFHYGVTPILIENTGHTIQVNAGPGHWLELDGERYDLIQFHFHTPSEHTIDGEHRAGEMHLVHRNGEGDLVVVAVFMDKGTKNQAYADMLEFLPSDPGLKLDFDDSASIAALLPTVHTAYRYEGSLTTPPCTEGVQWVVLSEPVLLSVAQLTPIADVLKNNVRPVQPLNQRVVELDTTP